MVPMQLSRILIRELTDVQVIELREIVDKGQEGEARRFPIVIGLPEAQAIERRLSGTPIKRPQTHDLLARVIEALGGVLERVELTELKGGTFYAVLVIRKADGTTERVDSRPSDAIALGIAGRVPILVDESVIEGASVPPELDDVEDDAEDEAEDDAEDALGFDPPELEWDEDDEEGPSRAGGGGGL